MFENAELRPGENGVKLSKFHSTLITNSTDSKKLEISALFLEFEADSLNADSVNGDRAGTRCQALPDARVEPIHQDEMHLLCDLGNTRQPVV